MHTSFRRDKQFWAAFMAAALFWVALGWWHVPVFDWMWPLREPMRFLVPALVYPVLEEIVFRGGLQGLLLRYPRYGVSWKGVTLANVIASLAFVAAHMFVHDPLWAVATLVPSLVFGYFFDRHASLASPIALHVFYNAGYFWLWGR